MRMMRRKRRKNDNNEWCECGFECEFECRCGCGVGGRTLNEESVMSIDREIQCVNVSGTIMVTVLFPFPFPLFE
jgi:hypothetical protein